MTKLTRKIVEFKLTDVDGEIIVDSPYELLVREPEGTSDIEFVVERDDEASGLMYEFASDETEFGFSRSMQVGSGLNPYEFLTSINATKGVDSNVILTISTSEYVGGTKSIVYAGSLDFTSISVELATVYIQSRRIDFDDAFRTGIDTKFDVTDTSVVNGNTIFGVIPTNTYLHGITQRNITEADSDVSSNPSIAGFTVDTGTDNQLYFSMPYSETSLNQVGGFIPNIPLIYSVDPIEVIEGGYTLGGDDLKAGRYKINGTAHSFDLNFDNAYGIPAFWTSDTIGLTLDLVIIDNTDTIVSTTQITDQSFTISGSDQGTNNDISTHISYVSAFEFDNVVLLEDYRVYLYYSVDITGQPKHDITIENFDGDITIEAVTGDKASRTALPSLPSVLNHVLGRLTGSLTTVVSNTFYTNLGKLFIANGYKLRNHEDYTSIFASFNNLFKEFIKPILGGGYAIVDDGGQPKILMDHQDAFYADTESMQVGNIERGSYRITSDNDLVYNELESGYKTYPRSTDENKNGNIDEYNTHHDYTTPITRAKKKLSMVSTVIASGYNINNQRIEQYKDNPPNTVSGDDKLFVIKCRDDDDNKFLALDHAFQSSGGSIGLVEFYNASHYVDIIVGDTVEFTGSTGGSNDSIAYTVTDITVRGGDMLLFLSGGTVTTLARTVSAVTITRTNLVRRNRAERVEGMEILTGINFPDTAYNAGLNPISPLLNHATRINSGFVGKQSTELVEAGEIKLTSGLNFKFAAGEGEYMSSDLSPTYTVGNDITLDTMNLNTRKFSGFRHSFTVSMSLDDILTIKDDMLNVGSNNYGYITFVSPITGEDMSGWIMSMTYNPFKEMVEFDVRGKHVPTGGRLDYALDHPMA